MKKTLDQVAVTPCLALASVVLVALVSGCATPSAQPPASADQTKDLPRTPDVAVAAFHREFPGAVFDEVVRPKGFANGDGVEPPLFWVVRHHTGEARDEAQITPDGLLVHRQAKLALSDVPPPVAAAIAAASPGASPGTVTRHDALTRIGYVALATPQRSWLATIEKHGKLSRILVKDDGTVRRAGGGDEEDEGDEAGEEKETEKPAAATPKEIDIPAEAARAVAAVKEVYPQAIVTAVETVPIDDGTGNFDVLQYEVEYLLGGTATQTDATPDGIVLRLERPAATDSLPAPVSAAIAKEAADGAVKSVVELEDRADLRYLPLAEPRVVYEVVREQDGKKISARFTPDGRRIQPLRPGR
jgi:hypothetical protein